MSDSDTFEPKAFVTDGNGYLEEYRAWRFSVKGQLHIDYSSLGYLYPNLDSTVYLSLP